MKQILCLFMVVLFIFSLSGCKIEIVTDLSEFEEYERLENFQDRYREEFHEEDRTLVYQNDEESSKWYYYNQLTEKEKTVYCEILKQVRDFNVDVVFDEWKIVGKYYDEKEMWKIERSFAYDHPEYYWTSELVSFERDDTGITSIRYCDFADVDKETLSSTYQNLCKIRSEIVAKIPNGASDYQKARIIYDEILRRFSYDEKYIDSQDISGILTNNVGVCAGYAYAFKFLCDGAGVECMIEHGTSQPQGYSAGPHTWNAIKVDGEWYWVDATWADTNNKVDYHFCMTDEEIFKTHKLLKDSTIIDKNTPHRYPYDFQHPKCNGTKY